MELLWISQAERFSLAQGETCSGKAETGEILVLAAARGSLLAESSCFRGTLSVGQAVILPDAENGCQLTAQTDSDCIVLLLSGSLTEQILSDLFHHDRIFCPTGLPDVMQTVNALADAEETVEQISSEAYQLLMRLHMICKPYEEVSGFPPLVEAAMGMIQEEFAYLDGVDELADRLEITASHLTRLFSRAVGISPGRYLRLRRLEYAKTLLTQPDMTVSLTADLSGFASANYFTKVFRREVGVSPSEYAAAHRGETVGDNLTQQLLEESWL